MSAINKGIRTIPIRIVADEMVDLRSFATPPFLFSFSLCEAARRRAASPSLFPRPIVVPLERGTGQTGNIQRVSIRPCPIYSNFYERAHSRVYVHAHRYPWLSAYRLLALRIFLIYISRRRLRNIRGSATERGSWKRERDRFDSFYQSTARRNSLPCPNTSDEVSEAINLPLSPDVFSTREYKRIALKSHARSKFLGGVVWCGAVVVVVAARWRCK